MFISAAPSEAPALEVLPLYGEQPYLGAGFVLRAYSLEERIVDACLSSPGSAAADLDAFFARNGVAFVLARFTAYGCYALRVERS